MSPKKRKKNADREGTPAPRKFGTLSGVFTPTLLTILGVIMYLREGWVVGTVGLIPAWIVIALSFAITGCTGLSMSSVTTNIRIGAGGAYSIISQSLGIEMGGSIGIPLYLSQTFAVAMYIFGFRSGWLWIFPDHPAILVDFGIFALLFGIAMVSAGLAFRIQYAILAIIIGSLVSIGVAAARGSMQHEVTWFAISGESAARGFISREFWMVFAVFFPAATGIMAGANMSGDLKEPRRAIPVGTLSAIGISLVVYMVLAYWLARSATAEELTSNFTVMIDKAAWGPIVLAGLLGATFSSALASLVGAPRILQALGHHGILPASGFVGARTRRGEPRHALYVTAAIVALTLMLRNLNAVAPLITMFFLITYAMINGVVFLEQKMQLISFRPLLHVPHWIPLVGVAGCFFAMFIVNPPFSLIAVVVVLFFYGYLARRQLKAPFGDVRSGIFISLAEWAARKVSSLPENRSRSWKPNLLIPVRDPAEAAGEFELIRDITRPRGTVKFVGLREGDEDEHQYRRLLQREAAAYRREGIFASTTDTQSKDPLKGVVSAMDIFGGSFFQPNVLFLSLPDDPGEKKSRETASLVSEARKRNLGALVWAEDPAARLGHRLAINVWLADAGPQWDPEGDLENADLQILIGYKLKENWSARLRLIQQVASKDDEEKAAEYIGRLVDLARLPAAQVLLRTGGIDEVTEDPPLADIHLMPLLKDLEDCGPLLATRRSLGASCLFILEVGRASALA